MACGIPATADAVAELAGIAEFVTVATPGAEAAFAATPLASAGHKQRPATHKRSSLQSRSAPHALGSASGPAVGWMQPGATRAAAASARANAARGPQAEETFIFGRHR